MLKALEAAASDHRRCAAAAHAVDLAELNRYITELLLDEQRYVEVFVVLRRIREADIGRENAGDTGVHVLAVNQLRINIDREVPR
jgi:hypothetical protein